MNADPVFTLTLFGTMLLVVWVILTAVRQQVTGLSDFGQGLLGIASLFALLTAAWFYYLEGRGRARHELSAFATVVPFAADSKEGERVLVQLAGTVTNKGTFPAEYECVGADIRGLTATPPTRERDFYYEVKTDVLVSPPDNAEWRRCMAIERRRRARKQAREIKRLGLEHQRAPPPRPVDSGVRYGLISLEAGESYTIHLEAVVPCRYVAVRLHFIVPKPRSDSVPEATGLVPLTDACRASREIARSGVVESADSASRTDLTASRSGQAGLTSN
ncbi:MAG TPA: hypothetical protein VEA61_06880 [Allosphingosinicella sp.]|nr:hypothetical protein [Allosphingosinicella sp.]